MYTSRNERALTSNSCFHFTYHYMYAATQMMIARTQRLSETPALKFCCSTFTTAHIAIRTSPIVHQAVRGSQQVQLTHHAERKAFNQQAFVKWEVTARRSRLRSMSRSRTGRTQKMQRASTH